MVQEDGQGQPKSDGLMIRDWFTERARRRNRAQRMAGFNYAAGQLLLQNGSTEIISRLEDEATNPFDYPNDFDYGMQDAIAKWKLSR